MCNFDYFLDSVTTFLNAATGRRRGGSHLTVIAVAVIFGPIGAAFAKDASPATRGSQQPAPFTNVGDLQGSIDWRTSPFSGDGTKIITCRTAEWPDCVLRLWDVGTCKPISVRLLEKGILWFELTSDGNTLLLARENEIRLWDVSTGTVTSTAQVKRGLFHANISPDGARILTKDRQDTAKLHLWRCGESKPFAELVHAHPVTFAAFSRDSSEIVTRDWGEAGQFHLWDAKTGVDIGDTIDSDFDAHADVARTAAFDASGKRLVFVQKAGFATIDVATRKIIATGRVVGNFETESIRFSSDGSTVALLTQSTIGQERGSVQIFEAATGRFIRSVTADAGMYEISPDGKWLFCDDLQTHSTGLYDLATGLQIQTFDELIGAMALSPDGRTLVFNHQDGTSVWRIREK